jgi:hypothetical protein
MLIYLKWLISELWKYREASENNKLEEGHDQTVDKLLQRAIANAKNRFYKEKRKEKVLNVPPPDVS